MGKKHSKAAQRSSASVAAAIMLKYGISPSIPHRVPHYLFVWSDVGIEVSNHDCLPTLDSLAAVIDEVVLFAKARTCVEFLQGLVSAKAFLMTSSLLEQDLLRQVYGMNHLNAVYIFCGSPAQHIKLAKLWRQVNHQFTRITPLPHPIEHGAKQCFEELTAASFFAHEEDSSSLNFEQADNAFMYTQIMKNRFLDMEYGRTSLAHLLNYCRRSKTDAPSELAVVEEFEEHYNPDRAIWWYTRECFIYEMVNSALHLGKMEMLLNLGFFVRDLHRQIEQLHKSQLVHYQEQPFVVYRAQRILRLDFCRLCGAEGGLACFNGFLTASRNRAVSLCFLEESSIDSTIIDVLFVMTIDSKISSMPFAVTDELNYYQNEGEVLFSMHSMFRVGGITRMKNHHQGYEVQLTLTNEFDEQWRTFMDERQQQVQDLTGWERVGELLMRAACFDEVKSMYTTLLAQAADSHETIFYHRQLADVKERLGSYEGALVSYEAMLDIQRTVLPANHPDLASTYDKIRRMLYLMNEYARALPYSEKALDIRKQTLPADHPDLAMSYSSMGLLYYSMRDYQKALVCDEQALAIRKKAVPPDELALATSYHTLGAVYHSMGDFSKAFVFFNQALNIRQRLLPPNDLDTQSTLIWIDIVKEHL